MADVLVGAEANPGDPDGQGTVTPTDADGEVVTWTGRRCHGRMRRQRL